MKKKSILFAFLIISLFISNKNYVLANNIYVNSNDVELTQKEYEFVNDFYGNDYFETMTKDDYDWISDLDINNKKVEVRTYLEVKPLTIKGTLSNEVYYSEPNKKITLAKSCDSVKCTFITNATWLSNPMIRSYDVIGARFVGTSLYNNTISTKVSSSSGDTYYSYNRFFTNGFGTSVKLPNGSTNIHIQQKFYTNLGGTVYASYQHAMTNISLSNSYYYTISATGLGGVFNFYGNASGIYDGMLGVHI